MANDRRAEKKQEMPHWMRHLGLLALGCLVWMSGIAELHAQMPLTRAQKRKRARIMRQAKCLKRCQNRAYSQFYRCGNKRNVECNIRTWLRYRSCLVSCKAPWFCKGFKSGVGKHCGAMCLREARGKRKRFCRRRTKKARRKCLRKYLSWRRRSRHACKRVCKTLIHQCSAFFPNKLPPPTPVPRFTKM